MAMKSGPHDLTSELWRKYDLGSRKYSIKNPQKLWIGDTTHRVQDLDGLVHCIPYGPTTIIVWEPVNMKDPIQF